MITTTTTDDFRSTKIFAAAPDPVFSALTDLDALTAWWTPAGGSTEPGESLRFLMGDQEVVMRVEDAARPSRVSWSVLVCEPAPDWVGTSIIFDLEPFGAGTELRFHHHGLNPGLECFGTCQAGWTHFLASLVGYVERGAGSPNRVADVERLATWRAE
ncbi:MAG: SRPBCC domain-containing protein, partial [Actinomycetota bacterium]|nr:SRPBCC domain-containing protein [Actinomycetota bacterium]